MSSRDERGRFARPTDMDALIRAPFFGHPTPEAAADAAGLPTGIQAGDEVEAAEAKAIEAREYADRLRQEREAAVRASAGKTDAGEGRSRDEGDGAEEDMDALIRSPLGFAPRGQIPGGRI